VWLRTELLDELADLIERRRMLDAEPQAYIDTYCEGAVRIDRPGWVEAEIEALDEQIDRAAGELVQE